MEPVTDDPVITLCLGKKKATLNNCCGIASLVKSAPGLRPVRIRTPRMSISRAHHEEQTESGAEMIC